MIENNSGSRRPASIEDLQMLAERIDEVLGDGPPSGSGIPESAKDEDDFSYIPMLPEDDQLAFSSAFTRFIVCETDEIPIPDNPHNDNYGRAVRRAISSIEKITPDISERINFYNIHILAAKPETIATLLEIAQKNKKAAKEAQATETMPTEP